MKFKYKDFECEIDKYTKDKDIIIRLYNKDTEHPQKEIANFVSIASDYGFLSMRYKCKDSAVISGYLNKKVFSSVEMIDELLEYFEKLGGNSAESYILYKIDTIQLVDTVEYNGE